VAQRLFGLNMTIVGRLEDFAEALLQEEQDEVVAAMRPALRGHVLERAREVAAWLARFITDMEQAYGPES
jgi:hypothetical protein